MADAILGSISLSLELCKGLVWYVSNASTAKSKASQISKDLQDLFEVLEGLEGSLKSMRKSQAQGTAVDAVEACMEGLRRIEKKLGAKQQMAGSSLRQRMQILGKRLVFPFKQEDLVFLKDLLENMKSSLQLALSALELEIAEDTNQVVKDTSNQITQQAQSSHIYHQNLSNQLQDFSQASLQQFSYQAHLMSLHSGASEQRMAMVQAGLADVKGYLDPLAADMSTVSASCPQLLSRMSRLEDKIDKMTLTNFSPPAVNQNISSLETIAKNINRLERTAKSNFEKRCTCRGQSNTTTYLRWPIVLSRTEATVHNPSCRYAAIEEAVTSLQFRFTKCSIALRRKAHIGLAFAYGAGSSSISPMLKCDRVVLKSSPAFKLVGNFQKRLGKDPGLYAWEKPAQELLRLFELRKASPHDRLPNGMTLLHYYCYKMQNFFTENVETLVPNYYAMGKRMLDYLPTQALERDDEGRTCIDYVVLGSHADLVEHFIENGLSVSIDRHMESIGWQWQDYGVHITPEAEGSLHGPEQMKVALLRSEPRLLDLIKQGKTTWVGEEYGISLYALATNQGWTRGCEILLEHHVEVTCGGLNGRMLLSSAVVAGHLDTVQFWFDARYHLSEKELQYVGGLEDAVMTMVSRRGTMSPESVSLCVSALVRKQKELQLLAAKHGIQVPSDRILDAKAPSIVHDLEERGVEVRPSLKPTLRSVYHNPTNLWDTRALNVLYDAGFRDVTAGDYRTPKRFFTVSPLFFLLSSSHGPNGTMDLKDIVAWFLSHGTDLSETWPGSPITLSHCLGYRLGNGHFDPFYHFLWAVDSFTNHISDQRTDNCHCPCSVSGCVFITSFCKGLTTPDSIRETEMTPTEIDRAWRSIRRSWRSRTEILTAFVEAATPRDENRWLISETIRLIVFNELDIRHTCCNIALIMQDREPNYTIRPTPRYPDPCDLQMIQEEDAHLVDLLEELVQKFEGWWNAGKGRDGVAWFIEDKVLPEINRVLSNMREEDKRWYGDGRRGMGVWMRGGDREEEESSEDSGESRVETTDDESGSDEESFEDDDLDL